jgi:hypothetical protein
VQVDEGEDRIPIGHQHRRHSAAQRLLAGTVGERGDVARRPLEPLPGEMVEKARHAERQDQHGDGEDDQQLDQGESVNPARVERGV